MNNLKKAVISTIIFLFFFLTLPPPSPIKAQTAEDKGFKIFAWHDKKKNVIKFKGKIEAKDDSSIFVYLMLKKRIFKAARGIVKKKTFSGKLGPFNKKLMPGEYDILAIFYIIKDGERKKIKTSYPLIIGTIKNLKKREKHISKTLNKKILSLRKEYDTLNSKYQQNKTVVKFDKKAWHKWYLKFTNNLKEISYWSLEFRRKLVAPLYPNVHDVIEQMAFKIISLAWEYSKDLAKVAALNKKGKPYNREELIKRLKNEIELNLKNADVTLNAEQKADGLSLYDDTRRIKNLLASLKSAYNRIEVSFDNEKWRIWSKNWLRTITRLNDNSKKYLTSTFGKNHSSIFPTFQKVFLLMKLLWGKYSHILYEMNFVKEKNRLKIPKKAKSRKYNVKDIKVRTIEELRKLEKIVEEEKNQVQQKFNEDYKILSSSFTKLWNAYIKYKKVPFEKIRDQWSKWVAKLNTDIQNLKERSLAYSKREYATYFPVVSKMISPTAAQIYDLADEIDREFKKEPEVAIGGHGKKHKYDRKKRIKNLRKTIIRFLKTIKKNLK